MAKRKKQNSNGETTRITLWELTYRDDIEAVIRELNPRDWAYIKHDKDKDTDGKPKKSHYHIWARWDTPVRNTMIKRVLGITGGEYVCRGARSQKACILYMTHETKEARKLGKFIYNRDEIITNIEKDELERIYASQNSSKDEITAILEILEQYHEYNRNVKEYNNTIDNENNVVLELLEAPIAFKATEPIESFIYELLSNDLIDTYNKYYNAIFRRIIKGIWGE